MPRKDATLDESLSAANVATMRNPRAYPFGFFLCWNADPLRDDGQFLWFHSPAAASAFLADKVGILFGVEPYSDDLEAYQEDLAPVRELLERDGLTLEARVLFNETFSGWIRLAWCGLFADLAKGRGGLLAESVVREYLGEHGLAGSEIPKAELDRFAKWLTERR